MLMKTIAVTFAAMIMLVGMSSYAQVGAPAEELADTPSETPVELFSGPRPKNLKNPKYPQKERRKNEEGWVQLHMMIDPQGKPYEVVVTRSTGSEAFEREALRTVEDWTFEPALMDGQPIDAGANYKIKFTLSGSSAARSKFVRSYKKLVEAMSKDEKELADTLFSELTATNLYEDAYYNMAKYEYYRHWGNKNQQIAALRRGIAHESDATYLPKKLFVSALRSLFALEVATQDFGRALVTAKKLKSMKLNEETMALLDESMAQIGELRTDDRSYTVDGEMGDGTSWYYTLLKNRFRIALDSGELAELKLRCDKKYVFFRYDPEMEYKISENFGNCHLEVVGNPGSTFKLTQS